MWSQQFGWLTTTPKFKGILTIGWGKRWSSNYITPLCDNYQTAHFEISSNCLFCGNSDKNYGEKGGYQLILVRIFNFQSMPSMSWRHAIKGMTNGSDVSIQEWNIFKTSMPRFMFTIFTTKTKTEHQFMPDVDMKRKSLKAGLSPGRYTESMHLIRWCLYLEANGEEQTTVNDLIVNMKNSLWLVMMIMTHRGYHIHEVWTKWKLRGWNVHNWTPWWNECSYIAASIVFLQCYSSTINQSTV